MVTTESVDDPRLHRTGSPACSKRSSGTAARRSARSAANQSNIQTEQTHLKAQQLAATYALKAGQMKIQEYLAGMKGTKEGQEIAAKSNVSKLAAGGGVAPGAGTALLIALPVEAEPPSL